MDWVHFPFWLYINFMPLHRHCGQRHYVFRLSRSSVCPVKYYYHDILRMAWIILIKLTGNIH